MPDAPGAAVVTDVEDDEIEERMVNLADLSPMEREYFVRLSTIRSFLRFPAPEMHIQIIQKMDNT